MSQDQEHFALDWIKGDLLETLDSARASLESYSESDGDETLLRACVTALHQVHGTLVMLELPGIGLLADHMEQLAQGLLNKVVDRPLEAIAHLMQGVLELPSYLEAIAAGQGDSARPVIPLINDLRSHLAQEPLELPAVNVLSGYASDAAVERFADINGHAKVRKIRSAYQQVLLSILKGEDRTEAVNTLKKVSQGLIRICDDTPHEGQWQAFAEFVESLGLQSGPLDADAIKLLRRIDAELRSLSTQGAGALQQPVNRDLVEALLSQAEEREHRSERLSGLREAVDEGVPVDSLVISGRQALASAALALREDVSKLQDQIDLDVRGETTDRDSFSSLVGALSQIGNTLSLLGFQSSHSTIFDQVEAINDCLLSQEFEVSTLADVAEALLKVDENLASATQGLRGKGEVERITSEAQRAVAREAREALDTVKGAIVAYVSSGWDYSNLNDAPGIIDEACGALDMIPLARPARQLSDCRRYIADVLSKQHPDWETLDQLADAISGVDYYLERTIEENGASAENVLDLVDRSLTALHAGTAQAPQASATEAGAEPEADDAVEQEPLIVRATPTQAVLMPGKVAADEAEEAQDAQDRADAPAETEIEAEAPATEASSANDAELVPADGEAAPGDYELVDVEAAFAAQAAKAGVDDEFDLGGDEFDLLDIEDEEAAHAADEPVSSPVRDMAVSAIAAAAAGTAISGIADDHQEDDEIAEIFLEEAGEVLDQVDHWLPEWQQSLASEEALTELRRAFHTLKGSGRMVGANVVGELAWSVENMLNRVLDGTIQATDQFVALSRQARELVPSLLADFERKQAPDLEPVGAIIEASDLLSSGGELSGDLLAGRVAPEAVADDVAASPQDESLQIFVEEAREHLAVLRASLQNGRFVADEGAVRALHTLAGSAAMADADELTAVARPAYELAQALQGNVKVSEAQVDQAGIFMTAYADALGPCLDAMASGAAATMDATLRSRADTLLDELGSADASQQLLAVEGIDALFDAGSYIESWRAGTVAGDAAQPLRDALGRLASESRNLDELALADFADALASAHGRLAGSHPVEESAQVLREAHEALLAHMDALVAGQVPAAPDQHRQAVAGLVAQTAPTEQDDSYDLSTLTQDELAEEERSADDVPEPELAAEPVAATPTTAAATGLTLSAEDAQFDAEILEIFVEEADELLEGMDETIHAMAQERDNHLHIENLLRDLHTMKGGARLATMTALGDLTHEFESEVLEQQAAGNAADDAFVALLHQRHDALLTMTASVKAHLEAGCAGMATCAAVVGLNAAGLADSVEQAVAVEAVAETELAAEVAAEAAAEAEAEEELLTADAANESMTDLADLELDAEADNVVPLMQVAGGPKLKPPSAQPQPPAQTRAAPDAGGQEMVRVGAGLLEELVNLAGESSIMRGRIEQGLGDFTVALDEMETTIGRVREQLRRLEIETEAQVLFRQERFDEPSQEDFDPLEMDRYSQLQQLSRSLSESASDMLDLKETLLFKARESETLLLQQARINTELQEGLMRTRMVPFSRLLPRLRRTVRQVSGELGKDVEFNAYNAEGELDRNLLDRMIPPLEHMLRNAVDHGIEAPSERRNYSKRPTGQIELRLGREGGDVLIEISDDGAGIDCESVREKAIERGLMAPDADLRDDEILQFVLAPGFSTAKSVTQISGRGVGMDVVHSEVKQLGGSISIASKPGEGARFSLRVPFTVSVNRALMVSVGDDLYAIPLNTIEGIVLLGPKELERLYAADSGPFEYAGVDYQVRYLGHFLGRDYRGNTSGNSAPVVLVRSGDQAIAVHVDSVQGSREIVVKSLGPQFAGVGGVSGATILGDGSVVVILDLLALIRSRSDQPRTPSRRPVALDNKTRCVMVVDDSVTVRKVTSRLLERQGMDVLTAKDGVEAVALLQERRPDILLLDIEMPRMDGFEVARQVRHDDQLEGLPIVMISSRTGEKHQERATDLGVNRFLGKPFQESELLETIDQLVEST